MFLGYVKNHTGGTYRMSNLRTKCIVLSCDVIWIKKTYREYVSINKIPRQTPIPYKIKASPIIGLT